MVKAAVLYEPNVAMPIVDLEQGEPKAGEVRVRMVAAGVCASDHHVMGLFTELDWLNQMREVGFLEPRTIVTPFGGHGESALVFVGKKP